MAFGCFQPTMVVRRRCGKQSDAVAALRQFGGMRTCQSTSNVTERHVKTAAAAMCRASRAENLLSSWSRAFCSPPSWGSQPSKRWAGPARPQMAAPAQPHLPPHPTPVRRSLPLTQTPRRTGASRTTERRSSTSPLMTAPPRTPSACSTSSTSTAPRRRSSWWDTTPTTTT